jgi:hypothetical protein
MNTMRIPDIKSPPRITSRERTPSVIRVLRSAGKVAPAAIYRPGSKWTVAIAFILAIALHIGAVALVEMHSQPRSAEFAQNSNGSEGATVVD